MLIIMLIDLLDPQDSSIETVSAQVSWAHSEHGSVIACASLDGIVTIWQQLAKTPGNGAQWQQQATVTDSHEPVTCMQFAPAQVGPQLAVASDDGFVRFYDASDAINADTWHLSNEFKVCGPFNTFIIDIHICGNVAEQRVYARKYAVTCDPVRQF